MTDTLPLVGPHNCPSCKAETHIADLKAQIDAHVCTDEMCGELRERFSGVWRRTRCWLWWGGLNRKLSIAEHNLAHNPNHHCKPHYCDFGPNCASFREELRPGYREPIR